ncbi:unnamed protein product [Calypogeia fissa]
MAIVALSCRLRDLYMMWLCSWPTTHFAAWKMQAGTAFFPNSSLAGNGLLVSDGDLWMRQRRLANISEEMVEKIWRHGGIRDIYAECDDLTMQIVASSLFGGTSGLEDMAEVGPAITIAFKWTMMAAIPEWLPTPDNLQYLSSIRRLARYEDGSGMDDKSLRDELMTFLVAGQETSASLLTWALIMIALHPELQGRLYDECLEILATWKPSSGKQCAVDPSCLHCGNMCISRHKIGVLGCAGWNNSVGEPLPVASRSCTLAKGHRV